MVTRFLGISSPEPAVELGDDANSTTLLEMVVEWLMHGRSQSEVVTDLVRNRWKKSAAVEFCGYAKAIAKELQQSPRHRATFARRGLERMQASYSWFVSGAVIFFILWFGGLQTRQYAKFAGFAILYGVAELVSGYIMWSQHRQFLTEDASRKARVDG